MDFRVLRNIGLFILVILLCFGMVYIIEHNETADTIIYYKGKGYKLYSLVGEGYTHKNRVPVYKPVFVPIEEAKNAF